MGLFEKAISKKTSFAEAGVSNTLSARYSTEEYEFLFMLIKNSTFKGESLEFLYNLTLKLQEDYFAVKNLKE